MEQMCNKCDISMKYDDMLKRMVEVESQMDSFERFFMIHRMGDAEKCSVAHREILDKGIDLIDSYRSSMNWSLAFFTIAHTVLIICRYRFN